MASFTTLFFFFLLAFFFATPLVTRARLFPANTHSFSYHGGPILHGPLSLHILWYGSFSPSQRSIITDFVSSFDTSSTNNLSSPSISLWWSIIALYSTSPFLSSSPPSPPQLFPGLQASFSNPSLSYGFSLNKTTLPKILQDALSAGLLPTDAKSIYMILTSQDVGVEDFCMGICGLHAHTETRTKKERSASSSSSKSELPQKVAYIWVGNAARQCAGECAWPVAKAAYGPRGVAPLRAPNGDVGVEGMVINMATLLAGTVTNPFSTGFFMGDGRVPVEAGSACSGLFGEGAFPGFPGRLLVSNSTGASFNVHGVNSRTFLLPALWNPIISKCITLP